ncbi:MAG: extracellular solute-binding protein [Nibricoccus sp.]
MAKRLIIILTLIAVVALPFVFRPKKAERERADETLVIITPHNEALRHEFGAGFRKWYKQKTGKNVMIDWRVIGGTSEIARFLEGEYSAAFELYWTKKLGRKWSTDVQAGYQNHRLPSEARADVKDARDAFMNSEVGCGIDVFFGGGTYDFIKQAQAGRLVEGTIMKKHPEWFRDDVIPYEFAGEQYWDRQGRWIGAVLSSYGVLTNLDALKRLGVEPPKQWADLKNPRLVGEVALADPTKSGSIAKAFENVIQQQMQKRLTALKAENPTTDAGELKQMETRAVSEGWLEGMRLMQLIGANARYFTDTSQKPPIDVAQGNSAAGMCIDFYGRQQEEAVVRRDGPGRLAYFSPVGGTVSSVDPIALLRGAKNRGVAEAFIEYVLSMEGQKLWNLKPGTPGGPEKFALRRMPVRRDFYESEEFRALRSDPDDSPFATQEQLVYRTAWTGNLFREMSFVIRVMCLDTHQELASAWRAMIAAGMPSEAMAVLQDLSAVDYEAAGGRIRSAISSKNKAEEIRLAKELGDKFRAQYRRAEELAKAGK